MTTGVVQGTKVPDICPAHITILQKKKYKHAIANLYGLYQNRDAEPGFSNSVIPMTYNHPLEISL